MGGGEADTWMLPPQYLGNVGRVSVFSTTVKSRCSEVFSQQQTVDCTEETDCVMGHSNEAPLYVHTAPLHLSDLKVLLYPPRIGASSVGGKTLSELKVTGLEKKVLCVCVCLCVTQRQMKKIL